MNGATSGVMWSAMSSAKFEALGLTDERHPSPGASTLIGFCHVNCSSNRSARDLRRVFRSLADGTAGSAELAQHLKVVIAREGGVLAHPGLAEAAVDLMRLAGQEPIAVLSRVTLPGGAASGESRLGTFARAHGLPLLSIGDVARYRRATEPVVEHVATSDMPTEFGRFRAFAFRYLPDQTEHLALVLGDPAAASRSPQGVLVRLHSECLTGDILASLRCDCGSQLETAMRAIAEENCGAVVYLRGHEGRGIGLAHKIRAYSLQDAGLDTVEANLAQGLPVDSRDYYVGAHILGQLHIRRLRLITNNPAKYEGLSHEGLEIVGRVALPSVETPHNVRYLRTKRERLGHQVTTNRIVP
jgi:3,4-dihydroxy 2-butanone 4-phosphate synthase/GTP cyclohydrolase II